MILHPRHRSDCADLFWAPHQIHDMDLQAPDDVFSEVEHAAARAGRTFNDQIAYIGRLLRGVHAPDFEDGRSVGDWCALMNQAKVYVPEVGVWVSFTCMKKTTHEQEWLA